MSISQIFENLRTGRVEIRKLTDAEVYGEDAIRPPEPQPATKQLRAGLERAAGAYRDREQVLLREIIDRQTELADVRHALNAASTALMELEVTEVLADG